MGNCHRVLGLGRYQTAWTMLHRFRRTMVRPGRGRLKGLVTVDETYPADLVGFACAAFLMILVNAWSRLSRSRWSRALRCGPMDPQPTAR